MAFKSIRGQGSYVIAKLGLVEWSVEGGMTTNLCVPPIYHPRHLIQEPDSIAFFKMLFILEKHLNCVHVIVLQVAAVNAKCTCCNKGYIVIIVGL